MNKQVLVITEKTTHTEVVNAFNKKIPISGIQLILTHPNCHIDEMGAIFLLQDTAEGRELFPGIENASIGVITQTYMRQEKLLDFHGWIDALLKGWLIVGVGGGPADEHSDRKGMISCTEMVNRMLNLRSSDWNRAVYGPICGYINFEDNNGDNAIENFNKINKETNQTLKDANQEERRLSKSENEMFKHLQFGALAQNLKKRWEIAETPEQQIAIIKSGIDHIRAEVDHTKKFAETQYIYRDIEKDLADLTSTHSMLIVQNDHVMMQRRINQIKTVQGNMKVGVSLLIKSNGQFVLRGRDEFKEKMIEVVKILRQKVSFAKTKRGLSFEKLECFGTIYEIPELYIDENQFLIMNGSKTDPDVPGLIGTHLSIKDIVEAVRTVAQEQFEPIHSVVCRTGVCSKVANGKPCSMFSLGLKHCRVIQPASQLSAENTKALEQVPAKN